MTTILIAANLVLTRFRLGNHGSRGPSLDDQVIAGIATEDFYLGSLGLAPWQVNFSSQDTNSSIETNLSFLSNLKNRSLIPSLSFGYSAGAPYRLNKVDGTLTLATDPVTWKSACNLLDFRIRELLSEYILIFVDSTVPHIWLPVSACKEFENVFGITHDPHSDFYLVNDTQHETLLGQNATVTFVIGNNFVGGDKVNITFPYLSFDLEAGDSPLDEGRSRYFPLRRAVNVTQYTLGRAFLQESYLIVDFERSNFSLSQATFVENAEQKLVPILSKDDTSLNITEISPGPPRSTHKLSSAAVAGIVVAIVLGLLIGATVFIISRWRARNAQKIRREEPEGFSGKPELDGEGKPFIAQPRRAEIERKHGGIEMEGSSGWVEIDGRNAAVELEAPVPRPVELPSSDPANASLVPIVIAAVLKIKT
ncbi:hypothetical protein MMC22_009948 [Lobaria immixta]|nr:hypothetical protein [Lobaria immixta]